LPGGADRGQPLDRGNPAVPGGGQPGILAPGWHAPCCWRPEQVLPRLLLRRLSDRHLRGPGEPAPRPPDHGLRMSGAYSQPSVYFFGQGRADGTATMKDVLGGKGAGLAEMTNLGIPVPPGFTIAATLCNTYLETRQFPPWLRSQVETSLQRLEAATNRHFGGKDKPLLVSVRSGAAVSMPGMMETILNLGLNDAT